RRAGGGGGQPLDAAQTRLAPAPHVVRRMGDSRLETQGKKCTHAPGGFYSPEKVGRSPSRKARTPARASSDARTSRNASPSTARPSSDTAALIARLIPRRAIGAWRASRTA